MLHHEKQRWLKTWLKNFRCPFAAIGLLLFGCWKVLIRSNRNEPHRLYPTGNKSYVSHYLKHFSELVSLAPLLWRGVGVRSDIFHVRFKVLIPPAAQTNHHHIGLLKVDHF